MDIVISQTSDVPLYRQLYLQISSQIIKGILLPGTLLPPIRTIAAQLRISIITVKRAWEDLERDGFIITNVGRGTFVAQHQDTALDAKKEAMARARLANDLPFYQTLGLTYPELIRLIKDLYPQ